MVYDPVCDTNYYAHSNSQFILLQTTNNCTTTHKDRKEDRTSVPHSQWLVSEFPPASSLPPPLPSVSSLFQPCTSHNILVK